MVKIAYSVQRTEEIANSEQRRAYERESVQRTAERRAVDSGRKRQDIAYRRDSEQRTAYRGDNVRQRQRTAYRKTAY
ncbi:MAG: hypothetical protein WC644_02965 [Ignavibacteria bacterium]